MRIVATLIAAHIATLITIGDWVQARNFALYYLVAYAIGALIGTLGEIVALWVQNNRYNSIRMTFYQKLTGKDMSFYRDNQTGYLAGAFRQHLDGLMVLARMMRTRVVQVGISVIVPVIVLASNDWRLGLLAVGVIIVQIVYIMWSSAKTNKYRAITHEIYRKLTGEVADEITNVVAFKSSGKQDAGRRKVAELGSQETQAYWMRRKTAILLDFPRTLLTGAGITGAILLALSVASHNPASVGLIVLTMMLLFQISRNVGEVPALVVDLDDYVTQVYPTLKYLSADYESIIDPIDPQDFIVKKGQIIFDDVSFSYTAHGSNNKKISIFNNLNLTIQAGEQVGVVGLSGAGKSTLASLLMRFDDVESGSIKIDGTDIKDIRQSDLHGQIAYVPQEPLLFHRTVRENIAYFDDQADDAQVFRAAKAAHAHEFIVQLPDGYDTVVGDRGIKLSGGQKQRVVIARAILKNAPVMIFDEATSALDSESEQIIQSAMPKIIGKHTAVVIAHRLSTLADMDRIVVMDKGKIIEQGTHRQLLLLRGQYYRLWQKQGSFDSSDIA